MLTGWPESVLMYLFKTVTHQWLLQKKVCFLYWLSLMTTRFFCFVLVWFKATTELETHAVQSLETQTDLLPVWADRFPLRKQPFSKVVGRRWETCQRLWAAQHKAPSLALEEQNSDCWRDRLALQWVSSFFLHLCKYGTWHLIAEALPSQATRGY